MVANKRVLQLSPTSVTCKWALSVKDSDSSGGSSSSSSSDDGDSDGRSPMACQTITNDAAFTATSPMQRFGCIIGGLGTQQLSSVEAHSEGRRTSDTSSTKIHELRTLRDCLSHADNGKVASFAGTLDEMVHRNLPDISAATSAPPPPTAQLAAEKTATKRQLRCLERKIQV
jgi:hypothetical protein